MQPETPVPSQASAAKEGGDLGRAQLQRTASTVWRRALEQLSNEPTSASRLEDLLHPSHEAIRNFTDRFGALTLELDATDWIPGPPVVQRALAEGLRKLTFRSGLSGLELSALSKILAAARVPGSEGLEGQLWQAQFRYIDSFWADTFEDPAAAMLRRRLTDVVPTRMFGLARGSQAQPARAEQKAALQNELAVAHRPPELFAGFAGLLFRQLEGDPLKAPDPLESFVQILDGLLAHDALALINQMVLKLRALEKSHPSASRIQSLRLRLMQRMMEPSRLQKVADALRNSRTRAHSDVARYLQAMTAESLPAVLGLLEELTSAESRMLVCDALAPWVRENPEPFIQRLASDRPHTVSDMVYLLERSNHPRKLELFGQVLRHRNLVVKIEALQLLAKGQSADARPLFAAALWDESAPVRMQAARLLPQFGRDRAFADLLAIIQESSFEKRTRDEKTALYFSLGSTAHPKAVELFSELLAQTSTLLNKRRVIEDKLLAISGLNGVASVDSVKVLQGVSEDEDQPPEVRTAATQALSGSRGKLFGDGSRVTRPE